MEQPSRGNSFQISEESTAVPYGANFYHNSIQNDKSCTCTTETFFTDIYVSLKDAVTLYLLNAMLLYLYIYFWVIANKKFD